MQPFLQKDNAKQGDTYISSQSLDVSPTFSNNSTSMLHIIGSNDQQNAMRWHLNITIQWGSGNIETINAMCHTHICSYVQSKWVVLHHLEVVNWENLEIPIMHNCSLLNQQLLQRNIFHTLSLRLMDKTIKIQQVILTIILTATHLTASFPGQPG